MRLPILPRTPAGFAEFSRRAGDYAIAMAVATYRLKDGMMTDMRIAIGGAEAAPRRIAEAERALAGRPPNLEPSRPPPQAATEAIDPLEDTIISADFRRDLVRAMVAPRAGGAAA